MKTKWCLSYLKYWTLVASRLRSPSKSRLGSALFKKTTSTSTSSRAGWKKSACNQNDNNNQSEIFYRGRFHQNLTHVFFVQKQIAQLSLVTFQICNFWHQNFVQKMSAFNAVEIDISGQFHQHFTSSFIARRYANMCFFSNKVTSFLIYTRNKWRYSTKVRFDLAIFAFNQYC